MYLNFLSVEFFAKKRWFCCADSQILIQSDQYIPNSICGCSKSADRKLLYLWNLTCYLRSFITKILPTSAKCCRIHPTWNMSQLTPPSHFRLSFNRYGRRYCRQLSNSLVDCCLCPPAVAVTAPAIVVIAATATVAIACCCRRRRHRRCLRCRQHWLLQPLPSLCHRCCCRCRRCCRHRCRCCRRRCRCCVAAIVVFVTVAAVVITVAVVVAAATTIVATAAAVIIAVGVTCRRRFVDCCLRRHCHYHRHLPMLPPQPTL